MADSAVRGPDSRGGLVVACVAPADLRPEVDPLTGEVHVEDDRSELSDSDAAALEYALRAADTWRARVVVVAAGSRSVESALRDAIALGAEAVRVDWSPGHDDHPPPGPRRCDPAELAGDPATTAAALATGIATVGTPDLVVCGDRSTLGGAGAVPALLAAGLGAAQALGLVSVAFGESGEISAERRLDAGWRERLIVGTPAVCSVEAAGVRLRRASLDGALRAAAAAITVVTAPSRSGGPLAARAGNPRAYRPRTKVVAPPAGATHDRMLSLTGALVTHDPPRLVGPTGPAEAVTELLDFLERRGVIAGESLPHPSR